MSATEERILTGYRRTHECGEPRKSDIGIQMALTGWAHHRRDHGGVIFVDLRDRSGITQVVFRPEVLDSEPFKQAHSIRNEFCLSVKGELIARTEETVNPNMPTGEVELVVNEFEILNPSKPIPFKLDEHGKMGEETRLRHRYLDLRRPEIQRNMTRRHIFFQACRKFLSEEGYLEIETPILAKATPEGARDFLIPSRMHPGQFYALPQSPQIFKQLCMVAGFEKYFQLARCFRDEDLRAHRTLEFTQIDIEASFIEPDDIFDLIERMFQRLFKSVIDFDLPTPFPRMTYDEAMLRYGSDKPDLRFELPIQDATDVFADGCDFKVFNVVTDKGGVIRALGVPGGADLYSNTQLKPEGEVNRHAQNYGAKGVAWFRVTDEGDLDSNIVKFFDEGCRKRLIERVGAGAGDLILIVADKPKVAATAMGQLRLKVAADQNRIEQGVFKPVWVTDFPLVEWNDKEKRWDPSHHPFTMPHPSDIPMLETDIGKVRSLAYDLALNGIEAGGGSIRIHKRDIQSHVFSAIGISEEEARLKFGFLLDALDYGAPPHGGIAFGIDRLLMIMLGVENNREVIPFPTNQTGMDLMSGAPSTASAAQLEELFIASTWKDKDEDAEKQDE